MLTIYRDPGGSVRSGGLRALPGEVIWIDLLNPGEEEKEFVQRQEAKWKKLARDPRRVRFGWPVAAGRCRDWPR